jgi:hypothetical protein
MQKLLLKSLFVLISSITTLTTTAQEQRMEFGVQAGLNLSDGVEKADYILGAQTIKPGFQAGVTAAYKVYKGLQLQSGLSLTTKGVKHTANEVWIGSTNPAVTTTKTATNLIYLQLHRDKLHLFPGRSILLHWLSCQPVFYRPYRFRLPRLPVINPA